MPVIDSKAILNVRELFKIPRTSIEREFSPYFYRYFNRYFKNPDKFNNYLELCQYLFRVTKARDSAVLDLGCGFGLMATIFGLYGSREVVGYDMNTEKIEIFRRLLLYVDSQTNYVKPVPGDSSKIEYPDEYFDVVIANETFSHIRETEKSIKEVHRVLKVGGKFLLRDGNNSLFIPGRIGRRRFWKKIERGPVDPSWFRSTDIPLPYFEVRQKMILKEFPQMDSEKLKLLSKKSAGMFGVEILQAVRDFKETGKISKRPKFRYRNPITGEFPEKEINPFSFKKILERLEFEVSFVPHFYSESFRDFEMAVKRLYYLAEKHLPMAHLFLSPGFALLGVKKRGG